MVLGLLTTSSSSSWEPFTPIFPNHPNHKPVSKPVSKQVTKPVSKTVFNKFLFYRGWSLLNEVLLDIVMMNLFFESLLFAQFEFTVTVR